MRPKNTVETLLARIKVVGEKGCWHYPRKANRNGYKVVTLNGVQSKAHQLFYRHFIGPIPEGLELHHWCENKWCSNPDHLELLGHVEHARMHVGATNAKLTHDKRARAARAANAVRRSRPTCKRGHRYAGANLAWRVVNGSRSRVCRACLKITRLARERQ